MEVRDWTHAKGFHTIISEIFNNPETDAEAVQVTVDFIKPFIQGTAS